MAKEISFDWYNAISNAAQEEYDQETQRQLKEIQDSNWDVQDYLKEILWELRYARRTAGRP